MHDRGGGFKIYQISVTTFCNGPFVYHLQVLWNTTLDISFRKKCFIMLHFKIFAVVKNPKDLQKLKLFRPGEFQCPERSIGEKSGAIWGPKLRFWDGAEILQKCGSCGTNVLASNRLVQGGCTLSTAIFSRPNRF